MFDMPVPFPSEFRQRAIELARTSDKPLGEVATEVGISRSCPQNWIRQEPFKICSIPARDFF
jgi:transposase